MNAIPRHLAGFLLSRGDRPLSPEDLAVLPNVQPTGHSIDDWVFYSYQTLREIKGVPNDVNATPPYSYPVVFRLGPLAFQLLATDQLVALHIVRRELPRLKTLIRSCEIRVHDLVNLFTEPITEPPVQGEQAELAPAIEERFSLRSSYRVGYVAASTDAFPSALERLQFNGDDVTSATLFRDNLHLFRCHSCTLRQSQSEILRLGKDGFVSFHLPSGERVCRRRLQSIAQALKSLYIAEYIQVPGRTTL